MNGWLSKIRSVRMLWPGRFILVESVFHVFFESLKVSSYDDKLTTKPFMSKYRYNRRNIGIG